MGKYDASKNEEKIATENSTINGEKASADNPVIPKEFKAVEKTAGMYYNVDEGFIIEDSVGNQFVWVPVKNTVNFTTLTPGYFNGSPQAWVGREPDLVTGRTTAEGVADLVNGNSYDAVETNRKAILEDGYENSNVGLKTQFEEEYNAMVKSVETYGGFYVGRYETGWDDTKKVVVSKAGMPMSASWYGLYAKQKELYKKNSSSSVVSGMIYGCQWDAIMNWMSDVENPYGLSSKLYIKDSLGMGWYSNNKKDNSTHITGSDLNAEKHKVKNIYDLAGNYLELTQEANDSKYRVVRGGYYDYVGYAYPASLRNTVHPFITYEHCSSRLCIYVK